MIGQKRYEKWFFLLPALIIYLIVIVYPGIASLYMSLYKWNGTMTEKTFVKLRNYINLFKHDRVFLIALKNNLIWIVLTIIISTGIALLLALLLNRKFKGRGIFRSVFYFPYMLSGIVAGIIWVWMYDPQLGLINTFLELIGLENYAKPWLATRNTSLYAVYISHMWKSIGAPMILFLAGLQTIPRDIIEAADIDGASSFKKFIHVTLPLLKETFFIVMATQVIAALKIYDIIQAMTGGGPADTTHTLATWMVKRTFMFADYGSGTAIACIMVFVMMIIIIPYTRYMTKE